MRLSDVLDLVASTARQLLGLDFCGVLVPDAEERNLAIAGSSGLSATYVARVNSDRPVRLESDARSGAPSSRAYRSGRPFAVSDISREPGFIWGGVAHDQDYRSMLSVPLVTASGVIGTLNSYRSAVHEFDAEETSCLQLLAEHAALAITSARLVEDLREQHELVTRSEQIHQRLLRVAVRSGGMPGIAAALHDLLRTTVLLHDARGEVLAAAGPATDRAEPARPDRGPGGPLGPDGAGRSARLASARPVGRLMRRPIRDVPQQDLLPPVAAVSFIEAAGRVEKRCDRLWDRRSQ